MTRHVLLRLNEMYRRNLNPQEVNGVRVGSSAPVAFKGRYIMERSEKVVENGRYPTHPTPRYEDTDWRIPALEDAGNETALILAWDATPVLDGLDRARRILAEYEWNRLGRTEALPAEGFTFEWLIYGSCILRSPGVFFHRYRCPPRDGRIIDEIGLSVAAGLASIPVGLPSNFIIPWALATVCEARGIGTAILVP